MGLNNERSLSFNGMGDYVSLPMTALDIDNDFSILLLAKRTIDISSTINSRILDYSIDASNYIQVIRDSNTKKASIRFLRKGVEVFSGVFGSWNLDSDYKSIAVTVSGNVLNFYIDGVQQMKTGTSLLAYGASGFSLGRRNDNTGTAFLGGFIDNVSIWNRALTYDDITLYSYKKLDGNEYGLRGYWDFDESTGNTVLDKTTNGNNGTINGATRSSDTVDLKKISKFLIASKNNVYSYNQVTSSLDDVTSSVLDIDSISSMEIRGLGSENFSVINNNVVSTLISPKIVVETDIINPKLQVNAIPRPQLIIPKEDIILGSLEYINTFNLTTNETGNGVIKTVFSVDSGFTWLTYNSITTQFEVIDISNIDNVKTNGIDTTTFNSIGIKWNEIITQEKVRFAYYLEKELATDTAEISQLRINMDYTDSWAKSIHPTEYNYKFNSTGCYVTFLTDGTYKVNYIELTDDCSAWDNF